MPLLLLVVAMASVGSHMPARYRHYSLLERRVIEPGEALYCAILSSRPEAAAAAVVDDRRGEFR